MSSPIHKIIGARIRALRRKHKMSQEEVAEAMECDNATLSRYERGVNAPDGAQLVRLAALFSVSPAELLPDQPDIKRQALIDLRTRLMELAFTIDEPTELQKIMDNMMAIKSKENSQK